MSRRLFGHGDLRLYLLQSLEDGPRHGYDLIRLMEDRLLGLYTPSAGTIYPRLQSLEDAGLVTSEDVDGRRTYRLTDTGREELEHRRQEVDELQARLARSVGELAKEIRDDVRASVRDLRQEIRDAVKDVRREERRVAKEAKVVAYDTRRAVRSLQSDLQAFVSDVSAAARHHRLDATRLSDLRDALNEARTIIVDALEGRRTYSGNGSDDAPPS
ncbi:MAG: helix-turn-helix transcriptional regulator [Actinomycetota bacterium]